MLCSLNKDKTECIIYFS